MVDVVVASDTTISHAHVEDLLLAGRVPWQARPARQTCRRRATLRYRLAVPVGGGYGCGRMSPACRTRRGPVGWRRCAAAAWSQMYWKKPPEGTDFVNPLLLPIVAIQGMRVRAATGVLPPAAGPTSGTAGEDTSQPPLRVAVLGESTAAGCGADTNDNAFPGWLARGLATRTGRSVQWQVVGQYGATARRIRHRLLPQLGGEKLNVAVLLAGVNDVLTRRAPKQWGDDLAAIVDGLTERAEQVVVTGIPPFDAFPSLPTTLGRYLAGRARALDEVSRQVCGERSLTTWISSVDLLPTDDPLFFAPDRFHPSASGYRRWAEVVAGEIML